VAVEPDGFRTQARRRRTRPVVGRIRRQLLSGHHRGVRLRSFVVEPFRIPSGSMIPTLLVGDFILVNKFTYGLRLPVLHNKIIPMNDPQRGDVMVFRYPADPSIDYIKRVVGLAG
jgi:signal peptidase I